MKCPHCKESANALLHSLRFSGVRFSQMMEGYFRCRNCGAPLKQSKTKAGIPVRKKPFWFLFPVIMVAFVVLALTLAQLFDGYMLYLFIIAAFVLFMAALWKVEDHYMVFEQVDDIPEPADVRPEGWLTFGLFCLVALLLPVAFLVFADETVLDAWLIAGLVVIYAVLVVWVGNKLINRNKAAQQTGEAAKQSQG